MKKFEIRRHILLLSLIGFVVGAIILFIIIVAGLPYDAVINKKNIAQLHATNSIYYILDFLPLFIALVVYLTGMSFKRFSHEVVSMLAKQYNKTKKIQEFTEKLIEGNTEISYELDEQGDTLGQALINLRDSLKKSKKDEEKRRREDQQRSWVTEGLAKFGEILRNNNDNLEELSYQVISNLVKYMNANQGGFFILHEKDGKMYFELTGCIAYDRQKYNPKTFEWGEGLVGRCALEKETIFMTDIPNNYIQITSGLGTANPSSLLLVPLIINDDIHGVIEIASFNVFQKFEVEFVEKLGESIASTIGSVKINIKTSQLLTDSQVQAEKLAKQEEVMRRNMDELKRTQKEAAKQSEEFISFTNSVNHTLIRAEYDTEGKLLYANTKFLNKLGYQGSKEVEGRHISMFINPKDLEWFNQIWDALAAGGRHYENYMKHVTKDGRDLWTMATYTCVRNMMGRVEKILFLAIDTTEEKKQSLDYEGQIDALNRSSIKAEYAPDGSVIEVNDKFSEIMGYTTVEIRDKNIFQFINKDTLKDFKETWKQIVTGIPFEGQMKTYTQTGEDKWLHVTCSAVRDMYGDVAKVIFIANDITPQKKMELKAQEQTEQLKIQEEKLRVSQIELSKKLEKARKDMKKQYNEIEQTKVRHEKTLEGALDAIVTINQNGIIQFFNKAAEELWKIPKLDVLGKSVKMLLPDKYKEMNDEAIINYINNDVNQWLGTRNEFSIIDKNGEEIPVLITLAEAKLEREYTLTAFIQNVSIELF